MSLVDIVGWVGSVLIVGAYALNLRGVLKSDSPYYIWSNIVGGIFFIYNTFHLKAYPSMAVNVVWVLIAFWTLAEKKRN